MTALDIFVILLLGGAALVGFVRGLVHEVLALAAWIVGIAALGVIAARSVVERYHQIGMLRALGFQKEMVQLSFLVESSFIALLGILLGIGLGYGIALQAVGLISDEFGGLSHDVPWANIAAVAAIAYVASLLTTFLPARQASKIYPAEALRFE